MLKNLLGAAAIAALSLSVVGPSTAQAAEKQQVCHAHFDGQGRLVWVKLIPEPAAEGHLQGHGDRGNDVQGPERTADEGGQPITDPARCAELADHLFSLQ